MDWENFMFGVTLVIGGAVGGALLTWAYLVWPVDIDYNDIIGTDNERTAARARHPSAHRPNTDVT